MRLLYWASFCLAALCVSMAGCESDVSRDEDLGEVVFNVPHVPGADKPYKMPELGPDSKSDDDANDNAPPLRQDR